MIPFDHAYPYPSRRNAVYGGRGMLATSHPMATEAGMAIFRRGGNAIDAAVAAAAALCVVDPAATGPGGDLFAVVHARGALHGLNASGPSAALFTREEVMRRGFDKVPGTGWLPATVSGGPAGWAALLGRFGKLSMADALSPAAELAEGYPASDGYANVVNGFIRQYEEKNDPIFDAWFEQYAPGRKPLCAGQTVRMTDLVGTLREIGRTNAEAFYRGEIARAIAAHSEATGGLLRYEDFAAYQCEWIDPVSVSYRGYDIWEMPPNGQGIAASIALNIMEGFPAIAHDDAMTVHRQIESMKLAFADAFAYIADPNHMRVDVGALLSKDYAAARRALIGEYAFCPPPGEPMRGGTVYLCAADGEGNMISLIQSVSASFGSGVVVPGTGVLMQNRGAGFSMEEGHPNCAGPRKRSFHTIIPGFITKDGAPVGPFGVMGGHMQPQGHMQAAMNMIDFHMNPQAALDAPRWLWRLGKAIRMEPSWPRAVVDSLRARGHEVEVTTEGYYGRGQIIVRLNSGALVGGTEPRGDGSVLAY